MFMLKHLIFRQFSQILNIQLGHRSAKIRSVVAAVQTHSVSPHSQFQNRHPIENTCRLLINYLTKQRNLFIKKSCADWLKIHSSCTEKTQRVAAYQEDTEWIGATTCV